MNAVLQLKISDEGIAKIQMTNGENRFRLTVVEAWIKVLDELERNEAISGVIITGNDKYFSLGLDVDYFKQQTDDYVTETRNGLTGVYTRLLLLPVPTVAVINGHAFGAGAILALACDYRVMRSDRGWLCWPEVHLNMRFQSQHSLHLINLKIPYGQPAREAVIFGQRLTATRANELSLVDVMTSPDHLETTAVELIQDALGPSGISRQSLKQMKLDLYAIEGNEPTTGLSKLLKIPYGQPAREAVIFGQRLTATRANELSLVDVVTSPDHLESTAVELVQDALGPSGISRQSLKQMKLDLYAIESNEPTTGLSKL